MRSLTCLFLIATAAILAPPIAGAAPASFTPLGFFGTNPSESSIARSVSGDGSVVVGDGNVNRSFRWTRETGKVELLHPQLQYRLEDANDVSADGSTILGRSQHVNTLLESSYRLSPAGDTYDFVEGLEGVSADGSAMAANIPSAAPGGAPARWTADFGFQLLSILPGYDRGLAYEVSDDGMTIVGTCGVITPGGQRNEAVIWAADGVPKKLAGLGVDFPSFPSTASANGHFIAGWAYYSSETRYSEHAAVRWRHDGHVELLEPLDPDVASLAQSISGDGRRIVGWRGQRMGGRFDSFVWDPDNGMRDLQTLLVELGLGNELSGWRELRASDISADGLTVVGSGTNPNGQFEAFVATIPEPSTLGLFSCGLAVLLLRVSAIGTPRTLSASTSRRESVTR